MLQQRKIVAGESLCSRFVISCNRSLAAKLKPSPAGGPQSRLPSLTTYAPYAASWYAAGKSPSAPCIARRAYYPAISTAIVLSLLLFAEGFS